MLATLLALLGASSFDPTEIALIGAAAVGGAAIMKVFPERQNLSVDSANTAVSAMKTATDLMLGQLQHAETTIHELRDKIREQDVEMQRLETDLHAQIIKAVGLQQLLDELQRINSTPPAST